MWSRLPWWEPTKKWCDENCDSENMIRGHERATFRIFLWCRTQYISTGNTWCNLFIKIEDVSKRLDILQWEPEIIEMTMVKSSSISMDNNRYENAIVIQEGLWIDIIAQRELEIWADRTAILTRKLCCESTIKMQNLVWRNNDARWEIENQGYEIKNALPQQTTPTRKQLSKCTVYYRTWQCPLRAQNMQPKRNQEAKMVRSQGTLPTRKQLSKCTIYNDIWQRPLRAQNMQQEKAKID